MESGFYWIRPLLTVLEYDGKNLGTQGGLCQQGRVCLTLRTSQGFCVLFSTRPGYAAVKKNGGVKN